MKLSFIPDALRCGAAQYHNATHTARHSLYYGNATAVNALLIGPSINHSINQRNSHIGDQSPCGGEQHPQSPSLAIRSCESKLWSLDIDAMVRADYALTMATTGCANKNNPLEKHLYFRDGNTNFCQTFRLSTGVVAQNILQISLKQLVWFNRCSSLNFKVHFFMQLYIEYIHK